MTNSNAATANNPTLRETLSDLQTDAVYLHAMAQGVDALYDTIATDLSPASNAMPAMFQSLIERAEKLVAGIDALELRVRKLPEVSA